MRFTSFLMKRSHWAPQNENTVPFKVQLPLALKDQLSNKGVHTMDRGCVHELSVVLSCLEQNNYENKFCTKEVTSFQRCYQNYLTTRTTVNVQSKKGVLTPYAKTHKSRHLNKLLRQYPQV